MDRDSLADMAQSPDTGPTQALGVFSSLELRHLAALDVVGQHARLDEPDLRPLVVV